MFGLEGGLSVCGRGKAEIFRGDFQDEDLAPERMNQSLNRNPHRLRRKWGPGREGIGIPLENRVFPDPKDIVVQSRFSRSKEKWHSTRGQRC